MAAFENRKMVEKRETQVKRKGTDEKMIERTEKAPYWERKGMKRGMTLAKIDSREMVVDSHLQLAWKK
jgi:hypothetical protein